MEHARHRFHTKLLLLGCGLFVILCPILGILRDMHTHNQRLDVIANGIYGIPLPANTTILRRQAYVASLGGSGDACDYVAEQTMQTARTRTEVLAHYRVTQGPSVGPIGRGVALPEPAQYYRTETGVGFANVIIPNQQAATEQLIFLLQIQDGRDDAGLDVRCV